MSDYALKISIGLDGVPQVTGGLQQVEGAMDNMGSKTTAATGRMAGGMAEAEVASGRMAAAFDKLGYSVGGLQKMLWEAAAAFTAFKMASEAKDTVMFAANVQAATRALDVIANETARSASELEKWRDKVRDMNITTMAATSSVAQFARAQLPLEKLPMLASMAQGAAIMSTMGERTLSSSEALQTMVRALMTGQTVELHQLGLDVSRIEALRTLRQEMGMGSQAYDHHAMRVQELTMLLENNKNITDLYAKSQDLAVKQIQSSKRPIEEMKLGLGELFLPELTEGATFFYKTVREGMEYFRSADGKKALQEWKVNILETFYEVKAEIIRMAMLVDKLGGSLTSADMLVFGPGRALGNKNSTKEFEAAAAKNMEYEKRYLEGEAELQRMADRLVNAGNPAGTPYKDDPALMAKGLANQKELLAKEAELRRQAAEQARIEAQKEADEYERIKRQAHEAYIGYNKAFDDRVLAGIKDATSLQLAALDGRHSEGLISEQNYLDARLSLEKIGLNQELTQLKDRFEKIKAARDAAALANSKPVSWGYDKKTGKSVPLYNAELLATELKTETDYQHILKERQGLLDKVAAAEQKYGIDSGKATRTQIDSIEKLNAELLKLQGNEQAAADVSIWHEYHKQMDAAVNGMLSAVSPEEEERYRRMIELLAGIIEKKAELAGIDAAAKQAQLAILGIENQITLVDQAEKMYSLGTEEASTRRILLLQQERAEQQKVFDSVHGNDDAAKKERQDVIDKITAINGKLIDQQKILADRTAIGGALKALHDYSDAATNVGEQTRTAVSNTFKGLENALVKFAETSKLSFKDLINSIKKDVAQIVIQQNITGPLASGMSSLLKQNGVGAVAGDAYLPGALGVGGATASGGSLAGYAGTVIGIFAMAMSSMQETAEAAKKAAAALFELQRKMKIFSDSLDIGILKGTGQSNEAELKALEAKQKAEKHDYAVNVAQQFYGGEYKPGDEQRFENQTSQSIKNLMAELVAYEKQRVASGQEPSFLGPLDPGNDKGNLGVDIVARLALMEKMENAWNLEKEALLQKQDLSKNRLLLTELELDGLKNTATYTAMLTKVREAEMYGMDNTNKAIHRRINALQDEAAAEKTAATALTNSISATLTILGTLRGILSTGVSPEVAYQQTKDQFNHADASNVSAAATAFEAASKAYSANIWAYQADKQAIITKLSTMAETAPTVSAVDKQIALLTQISKAISDGNTAMVAALGITYNAAQIDMGTAKNSLSAALTAIQGVLNTPVTDGIAKTAIRQQISLLQGQLNTNVTGTARDAINSSIGMLQLALNGSVSATTAQTAIDTAYGVVQGALNGTINGTTAATAVATQSAIVQSTLNGVISGATATGYISAQSSTIQSALNKTITASEAETSIQEQYAKVQSALQDGTSIVPAGMKAMSTLLDAYNSLVLDAAAKTAASINALKATGILPPTSTPASTDPAADADKMHRLVAAVTASILPVGAQAPWSGTWHYADGSTSKSMVHYVPGKGPGDSLANLVEYATKYHIAGYATGTPYVPYDMPANIHQGEIIIDRASSDVLRKYGIPTTGAADNHALVDELKALREEVRELRYEQRAGHVAIAKNTGETARRINRWDGDGMPPTRSAA